MRIIIEDDYRFVSATPGLAPPPPYQTAQALPYPTAQGPYQTPQAPFMQTAPVAAGPASTDVRSGGELASHVRQHVVTQAASTDMFGGARNMSTAAAQLVETVDIGPAPEWLKRVSVMVKDVGKGPAA
jgi:hypothetical protein